MNFFGHAALAGRLSPSPAFVLGAMVPDFATMLESRAPRASEQQIAAGIAFHHRTDAAFHGCSIFVELCSGASAELMKRGLSKGSARAVSHVGIEMLLDGVLAREEQARAAFRNALRPDRVEAARWLLSWPAPDLGERFERLCARLYTIDPAQTSAAHVSARLEQVLRRRPRLALRPGDAEQVTAWAERAAIFVEARAPQLVGEVSAAVSAPESW